MKLYGVFIKRGDGTEFLAFHKDTMAVFSDRKKAVQFKKELKLHDMKPSVKSCELTIRQHVGRGRA